MDADTDDDEEAYDDDDDDEEGGLTPASYNVHKQLSSIPLLGAAFGVSSGADPTRPLGLFEG